MLWMRRIVVPVLSALLLVPVATACGGRQSGPKVATVTPGEMPADGEWSGVYYDSFFGNLHLVREGDTATGKWRMDAGDSWGELNGTIDGNLLKYEWVEHKIGMVGASANTSGKGYFLYKKSVNDGDPDYIEGERGLDKNEVGQKWKGVKQNNVVPDPDSVMPDEVEAPSVTGGWDDEGAPKKSGGGGEADDESSDEGSDSDSDSDSDKGDSSEDDGDTDY